jgi:hypothetical protein
MKALLAASALLAGCAATPGAPAPAGAASPAPGEVRAVRVASALVVDGVVEAAWDAAPESTIALEGTGGPAQVRVRAAVADGTLHLLLRWPDATEDRAHRPWRRGDDGAWKATNVFEDQASVGFPLEGDFTADMTSPIEARWDVWHWKACRTDAAGHAQDRVHVMTFTDPGGKRHVEALPDGRQLYIVRPEDAGSSVTETLPAPADAAAASPSPQFRARRPTGSAADVSARGAWSDGWWNLELARALSTGNADDLSLADARTVPFALAFLDRSLDEEHTTSPVLQLLLPPPPPPPPEPERKP